MEKDIRNNLDCLQNLEVFYENRTIAINKNIETLYNKALQTEFDVSLGFKKGQRRLGNKDKPYRNGYYKRELIDISGRIEVRIPRDRKGLFRSQILEAYKRKTTSFTELLYTLIFSSPTYQDAQDNINALLKTSNVHYSKEMITRMAKEFYKIGTNFNNTPLSSDYVGIFLDATYVPIRIPYKNTTKIEKQAICIAIGLKNDHTMECLGYYVVEEECINAYREILKSIKNRGVKNVSVFVSDGFKGIDSVIYEFFPNSNFQTCLKHLIRNIKKDFYNKQECSSFINEFCSIHKTSITYKDSIKNFDEFTKKWFDSTMLCSIWNIPPSDLFAYKKTKPEFHKSLYTNNPIENFNKHIKRDCKRRIILTKLTLDITLYNRIKVFNENQKSPSHLQKIKDSLIFKKRIPIYT